MRTERTAPLVPNHEAAVRARAYLTCALPFPTWAASQSSPTWGRVAMWRAIVDKLIKHADWSADVETAALAYLGVAEADRFLASHQPDADGTMARTAEPNHGEIK